MSIRKRFQRTIDDRTVEARVRVSLLRCRVDLYEDGERTQRQSDFRWRCRERDVFLEGNDFTALVHLEAGGKIRCNLSYCSSSGITSDELPALPHTMNDADIHAEEQPGPLSKRIHPGPFASVMASNKHAVADSGTQRISN